MRDWKPIFLEALANGSTITEAAAAAGVDRSTAWRTRDRDPEFLAAFEQAMESSADILEQTARRRAIDGWEEPVYQGGQLIGSKTVYSDSLLALLLKGRRKSVFSDRTELTGANGGPVKTQQIVIATGVPTEILDPDELV
jgi:hypothetical protein